MIRNFITCRFENGLFELRQIYNQPTFTERTQTRAYTIDDLVGTIGGYIGLFTGYALVHFPELIKSIVDLCKRNILEKGKNIEC